MSKNVLLTVSYADGFRKKASDSGVFSDPMYGVIHRQIATICGSSSPTDQIEWLLNICIAVYNPLVYSTIYAGDDALLYPDSMDDTERLDNYLYRLERYTEAVMSVIWTQIPGIHSAIYRQDKRLEDIYETWGNKVMDLIEFIFTNNEEMNSSHLDMTKWVSANLAYYKQYGSNVIHNKEKINYE